MDIGKHIKTIYAEPAEATPAREVEPTSLPQVEREAPAREHEPEHQRMGA
ncbi:MAG: hypothetical protein AB7J46_06200 [Candidatus Altimarinota bacterium]